VRAHTDKKPLRHAVSLPTWSGARWRAAPAEGASCAPSPDEQKERPRAALFRARLRPLADTPMAPPLPLLPPKAFPPTLFALHALPTVALDVSDMCDIVRAGSEFPVLILKKEILRKHSEFHLFSSCLHGWRGCCSVGVGCCRAWRSARWTRSRSALVQCGR
jgi:hypothetical protein